MDKNGICATQESIDEAWNHIEKSLQIIEKIWLNP